VEIQSFHHDLGLCFDQLKLLVLVSHFQGMCFTSEDVLSSLLAQRGLMVDTEIRLQGWYKQFLIQPARRRKNSTRLHASIALALSPVSSY